MIRSDLVLAATLALLVLLGQQVSSSRDRSCCRYTCDGESACPSYCATKESCVIIGQHQSRLPATNSCQVPYDSKYDRPSGHRQDCLSRSFSSDSSLSLETLPFHLSAYAFQGGPAPTSPQATRFTGLDLRLNMVATLMRARFRIKNKNEKICPHDGILDEGSLCNPRCVNVEFSPGDMAKEAAFLSYDCEVGFHKSRTVLVSAAGHDHELSVCLEYSTSDSGSVSVTRCGQFLFLLPEPHTLGASEQPLLLTDMQQFESHENIVAYFPPSESNTNLSVEVIKVSDNSSGEVVQVTHIRSSQVLELGRIDRQWGNRVQLRLVAGSGEVLGLSAVLVLPEEGHQALALVTAILTAMALICLVLLAYRRWQRVAESSCLDPSVLVSEGSLTARPILIVTPLDHPPHVEVVREFCKYLRDWCGVSHTFFALDDETGIVASQMDPWKWCQETGEKVRESGSLVFIAGPHPELQSKTISIHPNLEENQAFLTTRHLKAMSVEGRCVVATFPYSSLCSLPQEVPHHLKTQAFMLPKHMNEFLAQLLQVKKQALCNFFPWPVVRPSILPSDLTRCGGGPQLLEKIRELSTTAYNGAERELKAANHNGLSVKVIKDKPLAPTVIKDKSSLADERESLLLNSGDSNGTGLVKDQTLNIELEAGMPSVKQMEDRERFETED